MRPPRRRARSIPASTSLPNFCVSAYRSRGDWEYPVGTSPQVLPGRFAFWAGCAQAAADAFILGRSAAEMVSNLLTIFRGSTSSRATGRTPAL